MRARGGLAVVALGLIVLLGSCWGGDDSASTSDEPGAGALSATSVEIAAERDPSVPATHVPQHTMPTVAVGWPDAPPCSGPGELCAPRDLGALDLFGAIPPFTPTPGVAFSSPEAPSVEDVLEQGLRLAGSSPVHLAFRGTAAASSVRCEWRGVARTAEQREATIRSWLGLDAAVPLPAPEHIESLFLAILDAVGPAYPESARASFRALARGGVSDDFQFLACYVDYTVSEYVLGAGPTKLTVVYDRIAENKSYDLYWRAHAAGEYGTDTLLTEAQHEADRKAPIWAAEEGLATLLGGSEAVLFVAPLGAHSAIAVEAWQVVDQWDLQTVDGTVNAVRYGALAGDPEHTQTLAALTTRITTAVATDTFAGDRIANASGLNGYYRTMGAYGDIDPGDGATTTFTPARPPAALTCASGTAVTDPDEHRALVHDCEVLLSAKAAQPGIGTLNWSEGTAIASWDGVTTGGTPERVTGLAVASRSLSGNIPADFGGLSALTTLNLSNNSLTGTIPAELGMLRNLTEVRLSGNVLTGCIPVALEAVTTNDLSSLSLPDCSPPAPATPTAGTATEGSVALSWAAVANASTYRVEYRHDWDDRWTEHSAAVSGTSHTADGLFCERIYAFRVSAFGSGMTYGAAWGAPSPPLRATTGTCIPPVFGAPSYSFAVAEDGAAGTLVGSVLATDPGGVTYAIGEADPGRSFAIDDSTGAIAVTGELNHETTPSVALTVVAWDAAGGMASVSVTVTVTDVNEPPVAEDDSATTSGGTAVDIAVLANDRDEDVDATLTVTAVTQPSNGSAIINADGTVTYTPPDDYEGADAFQYTMSDGTHDASADVTVTVNSACENGTTVPNPSINPGLVADCRVLFAARDTLRGTATLDWSTSTAISDWTGVTLDRTPQRVTQVRPTYAGLNGTIPAALGGLAELQHLHLANNALTGTIPAELGELTRLVTLNLSDNQLTGALPAELGALELLTSLTAAHNLLTGTIPEALFGQRHLDYVDLAGNQLTGSIPPIRDDQRPDMQGIVLAGNQLSGPIPLGLGELDLSLLELSGNQLTGCIPQRLRSIGAHDLDDLGLADCTTTTTRTLTTSASTLGSISPLPGRYLYLSGTSVTVTATPDAGHEVARWTDQCAPAITATTCVLTMDANKAAHVIFRPSLHRLRVTKAGEGIVTPEGRTWIQALREQTVTASWNDATHELSWGGDCAGTAGSTCTLTMDTRKEVTATFTALPASRCATPTDADCTLAVYRGAPGDYAQAVDIPADVLLTTDAAGRYRVERGQQVTVVTAAPLPAGWTRFWLDWSPLEFGTPSPLSFAQLIQPVGTTYTFTVTDDEDGAELITFDLTAARPHPVRPTHKPELGDIVATTEFQVDESPVAP